MTALGSDDDDTDFEADSLHDARTFVASYVVPWVIDRAAAKTGVWCDQWENHPAVVIRLVELTASRAELFEKDPDHPAGNRQTKARWWVDVFDRHLTAISALDGPLRACRHGHSVDGDTSTRFPDAMTWFGAWFAPVMARQSTDLIWCNKWDQHAEVVLQVTELWIAWEAARRIDGGMLAWWDHAYRTLGYLAQPGGTFSACKRRTHTENPLQPFAPAHKTTTSP
jgi:hypothetical protein